MPTSTAVISPDSRCTSALAASTRARRLGDSAAASTTAGTVDRTSAGAVTVVEVEVGGVEVEVVDAGGGSIRMILVWFGGTVVEVTPGAVSARPGSAAQRAQAIRVAPTTALRPRFHPQPAIRPSIGDICP